jgi:hypothetical protein
MKVRTHMATARISPLLRKCGSQPDRMCGVLKLVRPTKADENTSPQTLLTAPSSIVRVMATAIKTASHANIAMVHFFQRSKASNTLSFCALSFTIVSPFFLCRNQKARMPSTQEAGAGHSKSKQFVIWAARDAVCLVPLRRGKISPII